MKSPENEFNEKYANEFFVYLSYINSVENRLEIDLRDNSFRDHHMQSLADFIKKHSNIRELCVWMPCNYLTDKGVIKIIETISNCLNLISLVVNFEW